MSSHPRARQRRSTRRAPHAGAPEAGPPPHAAAPHAAAPHAAAPHAGGPRAAVAARAADVSRRVASAVGARPSAAPQLHRVPAHPTQPGPRGVIPTTQPVPAPAHVPQAVPAPPAPVVMHPAPAPVPEQDAPQELPPLEELVDHATYLLQQVNTTIRQSAGLAPQDDIEALRERIEDLEVENHQLRTFIEQSTGGDGLQATAGDESMAPGTQETPDGSAETEEPQQEQPDPEEPDAPADAEAPATDGDAADADADVGDDAAPEE